MPPPPGLVDAKPITEVDNENKILVSNVWSDSPQFLPQFLLKVKEEYKMVKKLGSGGFASVFLVANQVKNLFTFWFEYTWLGVKWKWKPFSIIDLDTLDQEDGRFYAAKYQKTRDSEEKWSARTEVSLLRKMEPCRWRHWRRFPEIIVSVKQELLFRHIIDLVDFFEGVSESVIVMQFAEGLSHLLTSFDFSSLFICLVSMSQKSFFFCPGTCDT